ncbi:ABC transporter ATP-binding protein [Clostridium sp. 1001271B_151109_B4]|uniref:ABC transporter ATP-binding protein n=1 Tax=Clostridium sp. 1001271B_151109_B4 TaxID=2787148 RepID=UPI0018AAE6E6|nr:ABC transporter ATP-binding protein [Clostridium sp. 1001271B_151109_B4]
MSIIEVKKVNKSYNKKQVLKDINITFEENKIYGLLGRNGAGKTTLLNLITDRAVVDSGEITIDGETIYENDNALEKIYFMTERTLYPSDYKVKEIFKWTKEFYKNFDSEYALELAKKFNLNINTKIKNLSTGYNSICKIITTLASNANVLIFDEPVLGLDANHRELFYKVLMENYIENPKTIILSTHIIEEVSNLIEKVIILNNSKVISSDEAEELLNKAYTVSGLTENIDKFVEAKNIVNVEEITSFKSATIIGNLTKEDKKLAEDLGLKFSKVELQKLFIYLTEKEEI